MDGRMRERERVRQSETFAGIEMVCRVEPGRCHRQREGRVDSHRGASAMVKTSFRSWNRLSEEGSECGRQNRSICQSGTRSLGEGTESCPLMMGLGLSRNCASWVSLAVEIYTGRGGKSPRLSGMEEAQEMDEFESIDR